MVVVSRRAWPSRSATVFIGTSRRTIWDAKACRKTWAPGRGTVTPARRSARVGDVRHGRTAELPIRRPRGDEDHIRWTGRGPRAQRGHQGRPNVGRQWQLSLPSSFTGHTDSPVVPVDVLHREAAVSAARRPSRLRSSRMARSRRPLGRVWSTAPSTRATSASARARGSLACFHSRMAGTAPSMRREPRGWQGSVEMHGWHWPGCGRTTDRVAGPGLYERRDRRHGELRPVGRRCPRALGKKRCGIAPVHPPGPDDQAPHLHKVVVEALQPLLGLASGGNRGRARRYTRVHRCAASRRTPPANSETRSCPRFDARHRGKPLMKRATSGSSISVAATRCRSSHALKTAAART